MTWQINCGKIVELKHRINIATWAHFEHTNTLQNVSLFYTCILLGLHIIIFQGKQALILNIRYRILKLFSAKNHKEGMWREKKMFHLIFKHRIPHSFVCRERKGKLKLKAKCRRFEWWRMKHIFNFVYRLVECIFEK